MTRSRRSQWVVKVTHPNSNVVTPQVVGTPTRNPQVNGFPALTLPVEKEEKWNDSLWEEQPIEVWYDGERQPVEQLERTEQQPDSTALIARGGIELRNIVDTEYQIEESTVVADEIVTNNTTYATNIDPVMAGQTTEAVQEVDTTTEFQNVSGGIQDTEPFYIENGRLKLAQTCWTREGENPDASSGDLGPISGVPFFQSSDYSGGEGPGLSDSGDYIEYDFTLNYDIPSDEFEVWYRTEERGSGSSPTFNVLVDGNTIASNSTITSSLNWISSTSGTGLSAGSHTVRIEVSSPGDMVGVFDVVAPLDGRFNHTLDNDNGSNGGYLDGPEFYPPDGVSTEFDTVNVTRSVTDGEVTSTWNSTSGNQAVALSNNQQDYNSSSNTDTFSTNFTTLGSSITLRVTMSAYGSRTTATPQTGFNGHEIDNYTLTADLQAIPLIISRVFNDRVSTTLNDIADTGDFVWAFDIRNDGTKVIEFTERRGRNVQTDLTINNWSVKNDVSKVIERVIVFGATNRKSGEGLTANVGTHVALDNDYLKESSETVLDSSRSVEYVRGSDYEISYKDGTIKALSSGDISDGETLAVDYEWSVRATASVDGVTNPRTEVVNLPNLTTQQLVEVTAERLIEEVSIAEKRLDLVLPPDVENFSPTDSLRLDDIPYDDEFQIDSIEGGTDNIQVKAGSRESLRDLTEQISSQLRTVSRRS